MALQCPESRGENEKESVDVATRLLGSAAIWRPFLYRFIANLLKYKEDMFIDTFETIIFVIPRKLAGIPDIEEYIDGLRRHCENLQLKRKG